VTVWLAGWQCKRNWLRSLLVNERLAAAAAAAEGKSNKRERRKSRPQRFTSQRLLRDDRAFRSFQSQTPLVRFVAVVLLHSWLGVYNNRVQTPGYVPRKPGGFFGGTPTPKNAHFYFNLILVYTLYATNNAIFYCFKAFKALSYWVFFVLFYLFFLLVQKTQ